MNLTEWLFDPAIGRLVATVAGIAVIYSIVRLLQRTV